jgi:SARP family transcriptional regulator, regulator of embCAB operon
VIHFSILGPIEVQTPARRVRLRGTMQQTLLAAFLVRGGRLMTSETLSDELWGTTPPDKAENALQAHISRLRRTLTALEPDRPEPRVKTGVSGYQFDVQWTDTDAETFVHAVERVRAGTHGEIVDDVASLRAALELWRGPVFGGLTGGQLCRSAAAKYEEARTSAEELLYDLELKIGRYAEVIPELTELVANNPMRERFCSLLMVALYRSGRQTDALKVYRHAQHRLSHELGIQPSPVLQRFESAVLNHDPILLDNHD